MNQTSEYSKYDAQGRDFMPKEAPRNLASVAADIRLAARLMRRRASRQPGYYRPRDAQLVFIDASGDRKGEPAFIANSRITGAFLKREIEYAKKQYPGVALEAGVQIGLDFYESFRDYLDGADYEPLAESDEIEVPAAMIAAV